MSIELHLLGGFRLAVNHERREISSRKAKALLCRLAMESGSSCGRESLATLFWPDSAPATARQSLRQTLSELRRAVGHSDWLISGNTDVALNADQVDLDITQFMAAIASSDSAEIEKALSRYRGELIEGMTLADGEFDNWLQVCRERLRKQALSYCECLIQNCDNDDELIPHYQRMLELEPTLESAHRALMEIYISNGKETAAIRQYALLKHVLNQELGVEPDAEINSLYQALLKHRERAVPGATLIPAKSDTNAIRPVAVLCFRLLTEGADPEVIARQRQQICARIAPLIAQYGGRLMQQLDQFKTVAFGLDVIHGTEVDRARLAAEACVNSIGNICCGISAGRVLYHKDKQLFEGEPVSAAMKLANSAALDEIFLDNKARAALRMRVSTVVAGKESWRIVVNDKIESNLAPLIGRELELRHFLAMIDISSETRRGSVLLLRGEAGIGKSRLLEEYTALAEAQGTAVLKVEVVDYRVQPGMDAIGQLLKKLMRIRPGGRPERKDLVQTSSEELQPFVVEMLGLPLSLAQVELLMHHSDQMRAMRRAFVLKELVSHASQGNSLLIIVEDIHWADSATLDQLSRLSSVVSELPVVLVMSTRLQGEPLDHAWRGTMSGTSLVTLDVQPLRDSEAVRVAQQQGIEDEAFILRLVNRAGGNPLFIEQLAAGGPAGEEIPANVQSLIVARLDKLSISAQKVLSAASVLGTQFSEESLAELLDAKPELEVLAAAGMLNETDQGWRFHHALIQECCYQHMLSRDRKLLHGKAARHYQPLDTVQYANHLYLAGDGQAGEALLNAADVARDRLRLDDAIKMLGQVIESFPSLKFRALILQGEMYLQMGKAMQSHQAFTQAEELCSDDSELAVCLLGRGKALGFLDDLENAIGILDKAVSLDKNSGKISADIYRHLGNALFPLGRMDECLNAHGASLQEATRINDSYRIALAEGGLGDAYYQRGAMVAANEHFSRCVQMARENDYLAAIPANLSMLGLTSLFVYDAETALKQATEALGLSARTGDLRHELLTNSTIGSIQTFYGDFDSGLDKARRGLVLAREFGSKRFSVDSLGQIAYLHWSMGEREQAQNALNQALEFLSDQGMLPFSGPYIFGLQAGLSLNKARCYEFLHKGMEILAHGAVSHNYFYFYVAAIECYLAWEDVNGLKKCLNALEQYTAGQSLPWVAFFIKRARFLSGMDNTDTSGDDIRALAEKLHFNTPMASVHIALTVT